MTMSLISDELGAGINEEERVSGNHGETDSVVGMGRDRAAALLQRRARQ